MAKLFNYYRYENFLELDLNQKILDYCVKNQSFFKDSTVGTHRYEDFASKEFRVSLVLKDLGEFKAILQSLFEAKFAEFLEKLKMPTFNIESFEFEIAAHGDGAFFKPHIDTHSDGKHKNRVISAVYYFFNEPKKFVGGELKLIPFQFMNGDDVPIELSPFNNSLVIFPSFGLHEVLPVSYSENEFSNWRFAVNCWINKK